MDLITFIITALSNFKLATGINLQWWQYVHVRGYDRPNGHPSKSSVLIEMWCFMRSWIHGMSTKKVFYYINQMQYVGQMLLSSLTCYCNIIFEIMQCLECNRIFTRFWYHCVDFFSCYFGHDGHFDGNERNFINCTCVFVNDPIDFSKKNWVKFIVHWMCENRTKLQSQVVVSQRTNARASTYTHLSRTHYSISMRCVSSAK